MTVPGATGATSYPAEVLRPEARPLPYGRLDRQQQTAFVRMVKLLMAATVDAGQASSAPSTDEAALSGWAGSAVPLGPFRPAGRSSRNILVSGGRGTGKTTLMLSLARALTPAGKPDATLDEALPREVIEQINSLRRRLVWLETLDMEPIASDANLLGAVLARVEDAVGAYLPGNDRPPERMSLLYPSAGVHDVSRELGRLQTSVALSFGGNLGERAGSLDPDTFAVESRRTERERLGLDRRFAAVLAGLSSALGSTAERDAPTFVLPVDDADLNITECVPLLRLLRTVSSPHLVVVLAADVALLSTVLRLWYGAELAGMASPVPLSTEDTRVALDLAANAMRKHLPEAQRVVLGLVEAERALALRPHGPGTPTLGQVLGPVKLPPDRAGLRVDSRFGLDLRDDGTPAATSPGWPPADQIDAVQIVERLRPYSWPQVLRQPMRVLVDLYQDMTVRPEQAPAHAGSGHHGSGHPVEDSPFIKLALAVARPDRLEPDHDYPAPSASAWVSDAATSSSDTPMVLSRSWHGWKVRANFAELSPAEGASLIGAVELTGERPDAIAHRRPEGADFATVPRQTRWSSGGSGEDASIEWPWITHSTVWGYERELAWLAEADKAWQGQPDAVFGSWVAVMTAQLFDAPGGGQPFDRPTKPLATTWEELTERLAALGSREDDALAGLWLDAVGLLCTPEMGMITITSRPALLPVAAAERVQALRARRNDRLPPPVRGLAQSWPSPPDPPTSQPAGGPAAEGDEPGAAAAGADTAPKSPAAKRTPRTTRRRNAP